MPANVASQMAYAIVLLSGVFDKVHTPIADVTTGAYVHTYHKQSKEHVKL